MSAHVHTRLAVAAAVLTAASLALSACADEASSPTDIPTDLPTVVASATAVSTSVVPATVDAVIAAVASGGPAELAALIRPQQIACANTAGVGGPPPCGGAPEGTIVEVFPFNTCEREWQADLVAFGERWFTLIGGLYAVVRIDTFTPPEELPEGGYGIIYANVDPAIETAHALILDDNGVVSADSLCGGSPEAFLEDAPPFHAPEVILEGPAFN